MIEKPAAMARPDKKVHPGKRRKAKSFFKHGLDYIENTLLKHLF